MESKTYTSDKEFKKIVIEEVEKDIDIQKSKDNKIHFEYVENLKYYFFDIDDSSSTLTIKRKDKRTTFNRGSSFSIDNKDVLYIPLEYSGTIDINLTVGNINVDGIKNEEMAFSLNLTSGDINIESSNFKSLKCELAAGDISLNNIIIKEVNINKTNGSLNIKDLKNNNSFLLYSDNGLNSLEDIVSDSIGIESNNGDSNLKNIDIKSSLNIKNNTGKINLSLSGSKIDYSISAVTNIGTTPSSSTFGDIKIILSTNVGDIKVTFLK